jgi:hypothetical protein
MPITQPATLSHWIIWVHSETSLALEHKPCGHDIFIDQGCSAAALFDLMKAHRCQP